MQDNSCNWLAHLSNFRIKFDCTLIYILSGTAIGTLAMSQSMNLFRRPGVSIGYTSIIHCYMMVSFRTFNWSQNTYILNYHWKMWFHGRHLLDYYSTLFLNLLTLPDVYASILSKLLISLMGFTGLGAIFHIQSTPACTRASWMPCAMQVMSFISASHSNVESSRVDHNWWVIE